MGRRQYILNCRKYIFLNTQRFIYPNNKIRLLLKPSVVKFSSIQTEPFVSKYRNLLFSGVAVTSLAVAGYIYFKSKPLKELPIITQEIGKIPQRFVDPNLDANLLMLQEHGDIPYLIIGAGTTASAAIRAIRANDPFSKIVIIGEEPFYPYMRPPLTKELWFSETLDVAETLSFKQWSGRERSLFFEKDAFYCSVKDLLERKNGGVSVIRGIKVVRIDPNQQMVYLDNGKTLSYEKCLLAPGSKPKNLNVFEAASDDIKDHISTFKTVEDFRVLNKIIAKAKSIVIVGGGFLGSELACALGKTQKSNDLEVMQIFPESGILGHILPEYLSIWSTDKVRAEGVVVFPKTRINGVSKIGNKIKLHLSHGDDIITDHIIVAVGSTPNIELAKEAGLEIDENNGGYLVNSELEARKNLWIAGDAASFYNKKLGRRRVEHHDNAIVTGRLAGMNMAKLAKPMQQQSMFWSDLGPDIGYEAIGIIDSSLPTVGIFAKYSDQLGDLKSIEFDSSVKTESNSTILNHQSSPSKQNDFRKGVLFYIKDKKVVGIILWNIFGQMNIARQILDEVTTIDNLVEVGKLFKFNGIVEEDL